MLRKVAVDVLYFTHGREQDSGYTALVVPLRRPPIRPQVKQLMMAPKTATMPWNVSAMLREHVLDTHIDNSLEDTSDRVDNCHDAAANGSEDVLYSLSIVAVCD